MPIDIIFIRSNPELVKESEIKRFKDPQIIDTILSLDNHWRQLTGEIDNLQKEKNKNQEKISIFYKSKQEKFANNLNDLLNENKIIDKNIISTKQSQENIAKQIKFFINSIGNIIAPDVVISNNEDVDNKIIRTYGDITQYDPILNPNKFKFNHHTLLHKIGGFEPERGAKIAGHKGYFLTDVGLQLNQALINYSLTFLKEKLFTLIQPPYFIKK